MSTWSPGRQQPRSSASSRPCPRRTPGRAGRPRARPASSPARCAWGCRCVRTRSPSAGRRRRPARRWTTRRWGRPPRPWSGRAPGRRAGRASRIRSHDPSRSPASQRAGGPRNARMSARVTMPAGRPSTSTKAPSPPRSADRLRAARCPEAGQGRRQVPLEGVGERRCR